MDEKLDKLNAVLKGTKPAKLEENPNHGFWIFPDEDHLDPLTPPKLAAARGDKEAVIEQMVFKDAFAANVRARVRMDILPGFSEITSYITEDKGHYRLVSLWSQTPIIMIVYPPIHRRGVPPDPPIDPRKVKLVRDAIDLPPALAREIIADWKDALVWAVPTTRGHLGSDGTSFYFSMEDTSAAYAGFTRSSDGLPVLDALEALAMDMAIYCEYGATSVDKCYWKGTDELANDAKELTRALKAKRR